MKKLYKVEFTTKKGGTRHWRIDIESNNEKQAAEIAKSSWNRNLHMFDFKIRKLMDEEEFLYHWFTRLD